MRPRRLGWLAAIGTVLPAGGSAVGQQSAIVGVVRDTVGRAIPFAEAVLIGAKKLERASDRGWFVFDSLDRGPDVLLIRGIGYRAQRLPIVLGRADTLDVEAVLRPQVQVLAELTVKAFGRELSGVAAAAARRLLRNGAPSSGLVTRDDLDTWAYHDLGSAFRRAGLPVLGDQAVCPSRSGRPSGERMLVYIDDMRFSEETRFDIRAIPPEWIEAIEVYRSVATRPPEYNITGSTGCLVLIWTRR